MTPLTKKGLNAALVMAAGCVFMGCLEIRTDGQEGKDGERVLFRFGDPRAELWGYNKKKKKPFPDHDSIRWSSDPGVDMSYGNGKSRIKIGNLPPGNYEIKARAQKGDKKVKDDIEIRILNDAPAVSISSPIDGGHLNVAAGMTFRGSATDREDDAFKGGIKNLQWTVTGPSPRSGSGTSLPISGLQPGHYVAKLTATDSAGVARSAERRFRVVNNGPTGVISGASSIKAGQSVTLTGRMFDNDSPNAPRDPNSGQPLPVAVPASKLKWYRGSTLVGTGASVTLEGLSSGTGASLSHRIRLVGTDEFGDAGEASFTVTVTNDLPEITVLEPAAGSEFTVVQAEAGIRFRASVTDDDGVAAENVTWRANGVTLPKAGLDVKNVLGKGSKEITVRAVDVHGGVTTVTLGNITIKNLDPTVEITSPSVDARSIFVSEAGDVTFTASVNDPDGFAIPHDNVRWSSTLQTLADDKGPSVTNSLVKGTHTIYCTVTDKHGGSKTTSMTFEVINRAPTVKITSPSQSYQTQPIGIVGRGQGLKLTADVDDPDGFDIDDTKVVWSVEVDGVKRELPAKGASVYNTLTRIGLTRITCTVTDAHGTSVTSDQPISINVENIDPRIRTLRAKDDATGISGTRFSSEKVVRLEADVTDPDGFEIEDAKVEWTDNGTLLDLTGKTIKTSDLKVEGNRTRHLITCTVTDRHGGTDTSSIRIVITNSAPDRVRIAQPAAGAELEEGDKLTLRGGGRDPEDGRLEGESVRWLLQKQGESLRKKVRTGRQPEPLENLPVGTHTLTLRVVDNDGLDKETSVTFTVKANQPPVVTIASPAAGQGPNVFEHGQEILFTGRANDPETGAVSVDKLRWTYQKRQGPGPNNFGPVTQLGAGVGGELKVSDLAPGGYRVTLTATDPRKPSIKGAAVVRVRVKEPVQPTPPAPTPTNEAPVAVISAPGAGGVFVRNEEITFTSGSTDDGAPVAADLLKWTVERRQGGPGPNAANNPFEAAAPLGTGSGAEVKARLRPGHYRVTLTVTDNADASVTKTATVEFRVRRGPPNGNAGGLVNGVNNN